MLKKSLLILFIIFSIICISSICFATDNTANNVKNAVTSGTNTIIDGATNLAEDVRNGVGHVEDGVEGALKMDNNAKRTTTTDVAGDYTATRTATTTATGATAGTNNTTMWIWIILAVAAIVIVALVWYYGSQNNID